jgi:hypothetical protein
MKTHLDVKHGNIVHKLCEEMNSSTKAPWKGNMLKKGFKSI